MKAPNGEHKSLAEEEASIFSVGIAALAYPAKLGSGYKEHPRAQAATWSSEQQEPRNGTAAI